MVFSNVALSFAKVSYLRGQNFVPSDLIFTIQKLAGESLSALSSKTDKPKTSADKIVLTYNLTFLLQYRFSYLDYISTNTTKIDFINKVELINLNLRYAPRFLIVYYWNKSIYNTASKNWQPIRKNHNSRRFVYLQELLYIHTDHMHRLNKMCLPCTQEEFHQITRISFYFISQSCGKYSPS